MHKNFFTPVTTRLGTVLILSLLSGLTCSPRRFFFNKVSDAFDAGITTVYQESDLELAEQFLSSNLETIVILVSNDPDNPRLNFLAAQAFGAYAMAFVEEKDPARTTALYQRGLQYAFKALPLKKAFIKSVKPSELAELLQKYEKSEVPQLFWVGYNWGMYILQNLDQPRILGDLAKVEIIMSRVMELDPDYNFGGADLFYGSFYAARPPLLGGNLELGRKHFLKNIKRNPDFLMTKLYYARYYAVQVQDKALFDSLLNEIEFFDLDSAPGIRLFNALSKRKAANLRLNPELFLEPDDSLDLIESETDAN